MKLLKTLGCRDARRILAFAVLTLTLQIGASAQWTVTNLHPAGSTESYAYAASGGQQAGSAYVGGGARASLWSGTAASWVDLHPAGALAGATGSSARGISGTQQVGGTSGVSHASLWNGTAVSWVDLNPASPLPVASGATSTSGTQQVGWASLAFQGTYASLWSGTAASWVNLHPYSTGGSYALGTSGTQQVGVVTGILSQNAALWSGTPGSFVDLNPYSAGATGSSAQGISGTQQVGWASFSVNFTPKHASLWSGTAASWVDLHPAGAGESSADSTSGTQQVGWASLAFQGTYASLWSGTAASWVDLHAFLPAGFRDSYAQGISSDGVNTYISGYGYNTLTGRNEALLWTRPLPPASISGTVTLEDWTASPANQLMTVSLHRDGVVVDTIQVALNASGQFSFPTARRGTYQIALKGSHWLNKLAAGTINITDAGVSGVNVSLTNGDVDGDNGVAISDYSQLSIAFNSGPGNGNWNPEADLNGDDGVDVGDFAILSANFGDMGD